MYREETERRAIKMKKKVVGIFVMTLLIATAYSSLGFEENTSSSFNNSIEVVNQYNEGSLSQTLWFDGYESAFAQAFIPEISTLTKVRLSLVKHKRKLLKRVKSCFLLSQLTTK